MQRIKDYPIAPHKSSFAQTPLRRGPVTPCRALFQTPGGIKGGPRIRVPTDLIEGRSNLLGGFSVRTPTRSALPRTTRSVLERAPVDDAPLKRQNEELMAKIEESQHEIHRLQDPLAFAGESQDSASGNLDNLQDMCETLERLLLEKDATRVEVAERCAVLTTTLVNWEEELACIRRESEVERIERPFEAASRAAEKRFEILTEKVKDKQQKVLKLEDAEMVYRIVSSRNLELGVMLKEAQANTKRLTSEVYEYKKKVLELSDYMLTQLISQLTIDNNRLRQKEGELQRALYKLAEGPLLKHFTEEEARFSETQQKLADAIREIDRLKEMESQLGEIQGRFHESRDPLNRAADALENERGTYYKETAVLRDENIKLQRGTERLRLKLRSFRRERDGKTPGLLYDAAVQVKRLKRELHQSEIDKEVAQKSCLALESEISQLRKQTLKMQKKLEESELSFEAKHLYASLLLANNDKLEKKLSDLQIDLKEVKKEQEKRGVETPTAKSDWSQSTFAKKENFSGKGKVAANTAVFSTMSLAAHDAASLIAHLSYSLSDSVIVASRDDNAAHRILKHLYGWAGLKGANPSSKRHNARGSVTAVEHIVAARALVPSRLHDLAAEGHFSTVIVHSEDIHSIRPTLANLATASAPAVFVVIVDDAHTDSFGHDDLNHHREELPNGHINGHDSTNGLTNGDLQTNGHSASIPALHPTLPLPVLRPTSLTSLHDLLLTALIASPASLTPVAVLVDLSVWHSTATYVPVLGAHRLAEIAANPVHHQEYAVAHEALKHAASTGGAFFAPSAKSPAVDDSASGKAPAHGTPTAAHAIAHVRGSLFPHAASVLPPSTRVVVLSSSPLTASLHAHPSPAEVAVIAVDTLATVEHVAVAVKAGAKVVAVEDGYAGVVQALKIALATHSKPGPVHVHSVRALGTALSKEEWHEFVTSPGTASVFSVGAAIAQVAKWNAAVAAAVAKAATIGGEVESVVRGWSVGEQGVSEVEEVLARYGKQNLVEGVREVGGKAGLERPGWWVVAVEGIDSSDPSTALHTLLASQLPIKLLLLTTTPIDPSSPTRPKDFALPALLHNTAFVASTSHSANPTHSHTVLKLAAHFPGPSVVVAYEPRAGGRTAGVKEAKKAVEDGAWPMYRWDPRGDGEWKLEEGKVSRQVDGWLKRGQELSLLSKPQPSIPPAFGSSLEGDLSLAAQRASSRAYDRLLASLSSTPLLILYGSDGGAASSVAKRLAAQGTKHGFAPKVVAADEVPVEAIVEAGKVVFVVSTAGQGEFPGNARETWRAVSKCKKGELPWEGVEFGVFAMGDSAYWGKGTVESVKYFAKAGKDLNAKLVSLGAKELAEIGLGDDQAADGYNTAFHAWTVSLWTSLGVEGVGPEAEPLIAPDDGIKEASNFLRGSILESLADETTGAVAELDTKMLKFHGTYMQDDRDIRDDRKHAGLEPAYSFMIRVRLPGGVATPAQWLAMDTIAAETANGTLKITTRQTFQLHGVVKKNLKKTMQGINAALMDTIAACGDVNRNVTCNPIPYQSEHHMEAYEFAKTFSEHLLPKTNAYHEIWLDKKLVATTQEDEEPFYGATYLPRKFKCAVAIPPSNDVDIFTNDLGFIGIIEHGKLVGYNLTVGGGMGATHGNKKTYPRLGDVLGYVSKERALDAGREVIAVQRDHGDRTNRKHARLKYTIDDHGLDWFRGEVEKRLGFKFLPAKPFHFEENGDRFGWTSNFDGTSNFTLFIENGRVHDTADFPMKTALRELAQWHKGDFRLTTNQHLVIARIPLADRAKFQQWLSRYPLFDPKGYSGARLFSAACVALPTCGLAFAESERYLPHLITKLEDVLEESGLRNDAIVVRMTGCPNGCARPYNAELAFVGKAAGSYNVLMGGAFNGSRLAKLYKESLGEDEIIKELAPIIKRYALERNDGEKFGDFVIRVGYVKKVVVAKTDFNDF
ncbi:hypothetical protein HDU93_000481 [Gonapodya sp. JEL0774]|nr:hypothetical protein HDU93_000481 [Gonapodya sp. JEL0774]